ncbi:MAG: hypothetical protein ABSG16_04475 [Candidatus Acidiferrum sp.]
MSGAANLVEVLATLYLLAIIGALAGAAVKAWIAKRGTLFPRHSGDEHRSAGAPSPHSHSTITL